MRFLLAFATAFTAVMLGFHTDAAYALAALGAITTAAAGLSPQEWDDQTFMEYVRDSRFSKYMGKGTNSIFQVKSILEGNKGNSFTFALVNKLKGVGVRGNATLSGNEESLDSRSQKIAVDWIRHGVTMSNRDEQFSALSLRQAAKDRIKAWAGELLKSDMMQALASIDGVNFAVASTAQKNTWVTNNADRVLFGATESNISTTFATAAGNVDNTADKMSTSIISIAKSLAMSAAPAIKPLRINGDEEWFVLWCNARAYRDLKLDSVMVNASQYARERGTDNPLFTGNGLIWDDVIIREIPEMYNDNGVTGTLGIYPLIGAGSIAIGANFLTGAQAVGLGWAQTLRSTEKQDKDYDFFTGVGVDECRGIEKLRFGTDAAVDTTIPKDHGMVTIWAAAVK